MATTTVRTGAPPDAGDAADPAARAAWVVVGLAAVLSLVGRVLLARQVVSPFIFQDEGGYVGVARLLAGETPELYGPTYLPGYGVLLAPAAAVLGPSGLQNAAQVLNAVAAAALIPVLHLLGRRVARTGPWISAGTAVAGGLMAASIVQATMLLPEVLFVLATAAAVLAVHQALVRRTVAWSAVAGVVVGLGYAVHPRSAVSVVAVLLVALGAWWWRALPRPAAASLALGAVLTAAAVQVLHTWATDQLYPAGTMPALAGSPVGALGEPVGAAVIAAGQSWYLIVASLGLVPLGLLAAGQLGWSGRGTARGLAAAFVVLAALGSLALGTIGSYEVGTGADVARADLPVYGRYLEQWVPVLVVLAPALVRRWAWPAVTAVAITSAGLGFAIQSVYTAETWHRPIAWHNIASLRVPVDVFGREHLPATGIVVAVVVLAVVGLAVRSRDPRWWAAPLLAMVALNVVSGVVLVGEWAGPASEAWAQRHRLGPVIADADVPVWVDLDDDFDVFWAYNVQFWHPDVDVAYYEGEPPPGAALVLGTESSPPLPGSTLVGTERDGDLGLWAPTP